MEIELDQGKIYPDNGRYILTILKRLKNLNKRGTFIYFEDNLKII